MKVLLGSLKYSAGLASGFTSVGNNLTQIGANVRYMVAHDYEWLLPDVQNVDYIPTQDSKKGLVQDFFTYPFQLRKVVQGIFRKDVPDIFWLYNSHPLNFAVMRLYKSVNKNGRAIIHLHEPYKPEKSGYSKAGQLYFWIVEQFQTMSLNDADDVVLPSGHALELFQQRYPDYKGGMHITPLIIPDLPNTEPQERKYISFIGNVNSGRRLDEFIDLIQYAADNEKNWQFQIVTSSNIDDTIAMMKPDWLSNVQIINKKKISDAEIFAAVAQSNCIFLSHRQVTQSGNVPVANRAGTPIIARNLAGLAQDISHKETGYLLPENFTTEQFSEAVLYILTHFDRLSTNARLFFEQQFDESNWLRYHQWLNKKP